MQNFKNSAIIIALTEKLIRHGSWCGETHIQKSTYMLKEICNLPLEEFDFVLYRHGPYAFELTDHLARLRNQNLIRLIPQPYPYGPRIAPTESANVLKEMYSKTIRDYDRAMEFISSLVNSKGVSELEKLATALYVSRELGEEASVNVRAAKLVEYKPHIEFDDAIRAIDEIDAIEEKAQPLR